MTHTRKSFGVLIEGRYGDRRGTITLRPKSKRSTKRRAEIVTALWWFLKYARAHHWRIVRKRDGAYDVDVP